MKKKNLWQIFSLLTSMFMLATIIFNSTAVQAKSMESSQIISVKISSDIEKYAFYVFPKHVHAINQDQNEYGLDDCDVSKLVLGSPFNIYKFNGNEVVNTDIYYFPVMYGDEIRATLAVVKDINGTLSSTFSKGFSKNLNTILSNTKGKNFRLIDINGEIRAVDTSEALLVANDINSGNIPKKVDKEIVDKINKLSKDNITKKKYIEATTAISPDSTNEAMAYGVIGTPSSSKYLSVPYVSQNGMDWCNAATCAAITNYLKATNLTAEAVVKYVKNGQAPNVAISNSEIISAYSHWGISSYLESGNAIWSYATAELRTGKPIHSIWYTYGNTSGHAMAVRGYEYYSSTDDKVYLLVDSNRGYTSVMGQTYSGNCVYTINGLSYYWTKSIHV